ncbi:4Fe-4S binding protein, partial [Acidobacteriota bacterium]
MATMTKVIRQIIKIDEDRCTGCGDCVPACAEGAIQIIDGKAKLISDTYCDGLGACLGNCPEDALTIEEREADVFDEKAVDRHLETRKDSAESDPENPPSPSNNQHPAGLPKLLFSGCPSAQIRNMKPREDAQSAPLSEGGSALAQWPIQLHLVPPTAPFLKGADLLFAADCVPFSYGGFHKNLLNGRALL